MIDEPFDSWLARDKAIAALERCARNRRRLARTKASFKKAKQEYAAARGEYDAAFRDLRKALVPSPDDNQPALPFGHAEGAHEDRKEALQQ
ncbi:MAG TPA: hypothetical protein VMV27_02075 [Candidatus Binataceae bacterium]|nr:hypothetical protein [Candidatus Binataceae bacterium]